MRVAILGTRGIPNRYGGFERCAEKLGQYLVKRGIDVTVYNPEDSPFKGESFKGIKIRRIYCNEKKLGFLGTMLFDFLSLRDARGEFDIVLELGYAPAGAFYPMIKDNSFKLITNMDGLEWKRSKWGSVAKKFLRYCEKQAVNYSDLLISDNPEIRKYYLREFKKDSVFIPYGADEFKNPLKKLLEKFNLKPYSYFLVIARFEPENNIDTIIEGYLKAAQPFPLVLVGNPSTKFGRKLLKLYGHKNNIKFLGPIYDEKLVGTLRWFSRYYIHGHSVGGTNPSLLEAMAARAAIVAHKNPFNKNILGDDAVYFSNVSELSEALKNYDDKMRERFVENNLKKIRQIYNWENVGRQYLEVFKSLM